MVQPMAFRIDTQSGVPIYQQVEEQIRRMIAAGTLPPGQRLSTVRELASALVINPNTVARAYQNLEREGVVETRRGLGTFACEPSLRMTAGERRDSVAVHLARALVEAETMGVTPDEVLSLWQERFAVWRATCEAKEAVR